MHINSVWSRACRTPSTCWRRSRSPQLSSTSGPVAHGRRATPPARCNAAWISADLRGEAGRPPVPRTSPRAAAPESRSAGSALAFEPGRHRAMRRGSIRGPSHLGGDGGSRGEAVPRRGSAAGAGGPPSHARGRWARRPGTNTSSSRFASAITATRQVVGLDGGERRRGRLLAAVDHDEVRDGREAVAALAVTALARANRRETTSAIIAKSS